MKRVWTLAAGALCTLSALAHRVDAAPSPVRTGEGAVISMSVVPTTGRAEVVIGIDGAVDVQDFTLRNPDKVVVDITGATLGLPAGDVYDRVARGGIVNIRYSQYKKNVVRVVLTLDSPRPYTVVRGAHDVRIAVNGAGASEDFNAWNVGERPASRATPRVADGAAPDEQLGARAINAPPVAASSKRATAAPVRYPALEREPQRSQQQRITIAWENAPITDVLASFAAFANRTIIPSRDVQGLQGAGGGGGAGNQQIKITAEITNQPWDVAMRAILNANGFDAVQDENGIIIVDTYEHILARQSTEQLSTRTVRLNYAKAWSVAELLKPRLTRDCARMQNQGQQGTNTPANTPQQGSSIALALCPARGAVVPDSLTNSVHITDIASVLGDLADYARSLDVRQPQVNIKAKIILVDRTQLEALGLRYDIGSQNQFFNDIIPRLDSTGTPRQDAGQVWLGGNQVSAIANATARIPAAALQLIYSTAIGQFDFTTFLEALQSSELLDVQAEPSASVLNNRTAVLQAGTQVPIRVIDAQAGGSTAGNFPRATVTLQNTGIILDVTPTITNNRQVQMRVHVENSDVQFQANSDVGAVFPRQSVDNEVLVADGETAVMGGLTQTTVRVTKSGLPVLMDLPLIGRLFGVTNKQETKRDLLILITPHIIDEGQPMNDGSRN
jgi:type IV pilus assembly protein PilQ